MDAADYQYVADTQDSVIRRVSPNGVITTVAGNGTPGASGDGGPATSASLYLPRGVAVGPQGDLFISDTGNDRIRKVDRTTGVISTLSSIK
ncbi:MAG: hypothetical protein E6I34_03125, partial [Chloroflexi bacterium]